ncbi:MULTISPECIES: NgoMIV family type II restriction endonuclease [Streptomyces]|uniref:NgoMIV family type II restriction endonuclease n=1 Tax=Streptomyces TaxID=1883 RepID=UPI00099DC168|nr:MULTISPECIES: NgoMIV family type II restriction endonuclease [Streptomyces]
MIASFATQLLGWKKLKASGKPVPNSADSNSKASKALAAKILDHLGVTPEVILEGTPTSLGPALERLTQKDLEKSLLKSDITFLWHVCHRKVIADLSQYAHLGNLKKVVGKNPVLSADLGLDYLIRPDVTVGVTQDSPPDSRPFLHAAISCKWTIRSDRVQNIRHEFLQMIRHRRGRLPHLIAVTAEPMPRGCPVWGVGYRARARLCSRAMPSMAW